MDIIEKVLTPADDHALIALEDAKIMLSLESGGDANDQQLQMQIEQNSATIARRCNRIFGKMRVRETHKAAAILLLPGRSRIFLLHYPLKEEDIESVEAPSGTAVGYVVEEETGKLEVSGVATEIVVTYTGGYDLPDESPLELQHAVVVMVRETQTAATQAALTGIRMLSHKSARVMFHPPSATTSTRTTSSVTGSVTEQQLRNLLMSFTRIEA